MISSVSNTLRSFTSSHPVWTILSLGSALIGLVYIGKQFSWIRNPFASVQKTDTFAKNGIKQPDRTPTQMKESLSNLETNANVRNQAKDNCYIAFATLSAAYAYFNSGQLPAFVAGAVFSLSIASVANRYFGTNPQKKLAETRSIFLGPSISRQYAEEIKQEYEKLAEELPPANYCFDAWGAARKIIDYKALCNNLQSQPHYNSTLPIFFIVFRSSDKEDVCSDGENSDQHYHEGVHCKAFFNIKPQEYTVVRGYGFEENKAKLEQAYKNFTALYTSI